MSRLLFFRAAVYPSSSRPTRVPFIYFDGTDAFESVVTELLPTAYVTSHVQVVLPLVLVSLSSRSRSLLLLSSLGLMFFTSLYIHRLNRIPPSLDTATSVGRHIPVLVVNTLVLSRMVHFSLRFLRQYIQQINIVFRTNVSATILHCADVAHEMRTATVPRVWCWSTYSRTRSYT